MNQGKFRGIDLVPIEWSKPDGSKVLVYIANQIGLAMEYSDGRSLVASIEHQWMSEFDAGVHFVWAEGEAARAMAQAACIQNAEACRRLMLLTEDGVHLACLKTTKPAGVELRRWLAGKVIPQVKSTGAYVPKPEDKIPEVAAPAPETRQALDIAQQIGSAITAALTPFIQRLDGIERRLAAPADRAPMQQLFAPPAPRNGVSELRKKLQDTMKRATAARCGASTGTTFSYAIRQNDLALVGEFFRRTGIDLDRIKRERKLDSCPDAAEALGRLQDLYDLAVEMFGEDADRPQWGRA